MGVGLGLVALGIVLIIFLPSLFWIGVILIAAGLIWLFSSHRRWYGPGSADRRYWY